MRLSDSTTGTIKVRVFCRFPAPILADTDFAQLLSAAHYTMELAEWNFAVDSHCSPDLLSLAFVFLYPFSPVRGSSLDLPHSAHLKRIADVESVLFVLYVIHTASVRTRC